MNRIYLLCIFTIITLSSSPRDALSHAVLLDSSPQAQEVLQESPKVLILTFNENIGPIFFRVLNTEGKEVGSAEPFWVDGHTVKMNLKETLLNGTYLLSYRVISADTHPVGSTIIFSVGEKISTNPVNSVANQDSTSNWWIPVTINRVLLYITVLLTLGIVVFNLTISTTVPIANANLSIGKFSAISAAILFLLSLGLGGAEMLLGNSQALFKIHTWATGWGSSLGTSALLGVPGSLLLFYYFRRSSPIYNMPLLVSGVLLTVTSFLVTGHAATAPPVWITAPMVGIHILTSGFWIASLYPIASSTLVRDLTISAKIITQFSVLAVWSVLALFTSGVVLTWFQVLSLSAMLNNTYGLRLSAKIFLFFILLLIAAYNKWVLSEKIKLLDKSSAIKMRATVHFEAFLIFCIISLAVSLTLTAPPRVNSTNQPVSAKSINIKATDNFTTSVTKSGYVMKVNVTPAKAGDNMIMLKFFDTLGKPINMVRLDLNLAMKDAGLVGIDKVPVKVTPGVYHLMINELIIPGEWQLRVGAFVSDFDKYNFKTAIEIK